MKKLTLLLCLFAFACAGTQAVKQTGREGKTLTIKVPSDQVFSTSVQTLMAEGFIPKQINEQYGFVTFEPLTMETGTFYKTVGIPGGSMMFDPNMNNEINLSCTVKPVDAETSTLTLKAQVFSTTTESPNPFSGKAPASGTSRSYSDYFSGSATNYYFEKILEACGVQTSTTK